MSGQQAASQKIAVSRSNISRLQETHKPRYPKDIDVGRIVIEEIPEEKTNIPESDTIQLRQKLSEFTLRKSDVQERPKTYVREGVVKVGKLDTTDLDRVTRESRIVDERLRTLKETIRASKVRTTGLNTIKEKVIAAFMDRL